MRKIYFATVLTAFFCVMPFAGTSASAQKDYLFEVDLAELPKIRAILLKKLGPTPFDCGRMMAQPAFVPEYSVSVYSRSLEGGGRKYFVTYIETDRNVWQATDIGRHPEEAAKVKIRRIDCEIAAPIAALVREAWIQMLSGNQRPRRWTVDDTTRFTDSTVGEFSIQLSHAKVLYGEMSSIDFPAGPKTKMLVDLANTLVNYCKAKPTARPAIARQIDRKATRLLGMLKG
jgi:hypothetical protein